MSDDEAVSQECTICLEPLQYGNLAVLKCGHTYHLKCVEQLVASNKAAHARDNKCPLCNRIYTDWTAVPANRLFQGKRVCDDTLPSTPANNTIKPPTMKKVLVTGKTFDIKQNLKQIAWHGHECLSRWDAARKAWWAETNHHGAAKQAIKHVVESLGYVCAVAENEADIVINVMLGRANLPTFGGTLPRQTSTVSLASQETATTTKETTASNDSRPVSLNPFSVSSTKNVGSSVAGRKRHRESTPPDDGDDDDVYEEPVPSEAESDDSAAEGSDIEIRIRHLPEADSEKLVLEFRGLYIKKFMDEKWGKASREDQQHAASVLKISPTYSEMRRWAKRMCNSSMESDYKDRDLRVAHFMIHGFFPDPKARSLDLLVHPANLPKKKVQKKKRKLKKLVIDSDSD
eukprot:TRINITY_DN18391_c0_g1_i1.p1 TRINITY_DN18391_c0_g1~~TRINITY_DN18391_c0_g1_i1.p1  ORF type:complete len:423 (+),score=103.70 TRINITY_DN18391_c0_g1_i1:66-1271(+)